MKRNSEIWLFAGAFVALLPILIFRDYTPSNELRYLSIADEAMRDHHFFAFTNQGVPYADKPPLYFWVVMLGKWLLGTHRMWFLSLASFVPAIITAHTMSLWTKDLMDGKHSMAASMTLLTSGLFVGLAVTLRMDMLMCMFIVLSLRTFWRIHAGTDRRCDKWLFPVYVFLAVFSKGPVGILVPLCTTAAYLAVEGRIKDFTRTWGWRTWVVLFALCLTWFVAAWLDGGKEYLDDLLFHQTLGRAVNSFHHDEPFWYYGISYWYSLAPWSFMLAGLIVAALKAKAVESGLQRFFLISAASTFVMLSCISAKLSVYLLPAFPFIVYGAMPSLPRFQSKGWLKALLAIPAAIYALCLPALIAMIGMDESLAFPSIAYVIVAALVLTVSGICAMCSLYGRRGGILSGIKALSAGLLVAAFFGGLALPKLLNPMIGYGTLCEKAMELSGQKGITDYCTWRISRSENMDVYLGKDVKIIDKGSVPTIGDVGEAILMVPSKDVGELQELDAHYNLECEIGQYAILLPDDAQKLTYDEQDIRIQADGDSACL